jgi:tRNA (guanine26-N2/guanine27-N2)-dimethyltransferase
LNFDFPTEIIKEGKVQVIVPKLEAYRKEVWEYVPVKAPVFYNPVMELNRDLAVLALQAYQKRSGRKVSVCEPLTGCGIRGIRFALEVNGVERILLNDINPKSTELARTNIRENRLENRVRVLTEDANLLLNQYSASKKRFDFIDIDPFGTPVYFLDSAIRALRNEGLLALTATDLAPLCGVHPSACIRKYGGKSLRTEYCHELALRLLIGCLAKTAAKQKRGIEVMFSHRSNHYVRTYALVNHGARIADDSIKKLGYILHCFKCFHREKLEGLISPYNRSCKECGSTLDLAGPLWLGKTYNKNFYSLIRGEVSGRDLKNEKEILRLLYFLEKEMEGTVTYYVTDKISDKLNLPTPPLSEVINELEREGCRATPTHFNSRGIRTDASAKLIKKVIKRILSKSCERV